MRRWRIIFLITLLTAVRLAVAAPMGGEPFVDAEVAPDDVTLFVHVENAAQIRRALADRPIGDWLKDMFENGQFHSAWQTLAASAGMSEGALFDVVAGQSLTLVRRGENEWALLTEAPENRATALLKKMKMSVRQPKSGLAVHEWPEQAMLLARDGRRMVLGPAHASHLFYEMLPRLAGENPSSLMQTEPLDKARELGAGCVGVYVKHEPPMGGWSAIVADLEGEELTIAHAGHFAAAPFNHDVTKLTCDFSPVGAFEQQALLAFMQPMDAGEGPVDAFVMASLGEGLISAKMRENLGDRRVLMVGQFDGRMLEEPVDILSTTFATCIEIKNAENARRQLDHQMLRLTSRLNHLGQGKFLLETPGPRCLRSCEPRSVDLEPANAWFSGGFPIMKNVSLNWTVADGPSGKWFVIGSHRHVLDDAVKALGTECPRNQRMVGQFDSCGYGNGPRIGVHLQSWSEKAEELAAGPEDVQQVRSTLQLMSELALGLRDCRWQLARPSANEMRLNVQITLREAESAR